MNPDAILSTLDDHPILRALDRHLLRLSAPARGWIFVSASEEVQDTLDAALSRHWPVMDPEEDGSEGAMPGDRVAVLDLRALSKHLFMLAEGLELDGTRVVATDDRPRVRAILEAAGLEVADVGALLETVVPMTREEAIERAMVPFQEHFSTDVAEATRRWLNGGSGSASELAERISSKPSKWYGERPAGFLKDSLTGAVERWEPETSGRVLVLWLALRPPLHIDDTLGLGEQLPDEQGRDRAHLLVEALQAKGLPRALAAAMPSSWLGPSAGLFGTALLGEPQLFEQALELDRPLARKLALTAIPGALTSSPTVRAHLKALLSTHSEALGERVLKAILEIPEAAEWIDEQHLEIDGADAQVLCEVAFRLEARLPGAVRRANERWMAALEPAAFIEKVDAFCQFGEKQHLDAAAAWTRVLECLEANPAQPFTPSAPYLAASVLSGIGKPTGPIKARLLAGIAIPIGVDQRPPAL